MKTKIVDVLLALIIIGSSLFIGWKFLKKSEIRSLNPVSQSQSETPGVNVETQETEPTEEGPRNLAGAVAVRTHAEWERLFQNDFMKSKTANALKACEGLGTEPTGYYITTDPVAIDKIKSGNFTFIPLALPTACYRKGDTLLLMTTSSKNEDPYITPIGQVTIEAVAEFHLNEAPEVFFQATGLSRKRYAAIVDFPGRTPEIPVGAMLVSSVEPIKPNSVPALPGVMGFVSISGPSLKTRMQVWKKDGTKFHFVDVRSQAERASKSIPNALVAEFKLPPSSPYANGNFSWKISNQELDRAEVSLREIFQLPRSDIKILVGNGPTDGRSPWLLRRAFNEGLENIFWYQGTPESLLTLLSD